MRSKLSTRLLMESRDRSAGLMGLALQDAFAFPAVLKEVPRFWNKPVHPADVKILPIAGVQLGIEPWEKTEPVQPLVRCDLIVEDVHLQLALVWWSVADFTRNPMDWLRSHCPYPMPLFGDGPMFRSAQDEHAFLAEFAS